MNTIKAVLPAPMELDFRQAMEHIGGESLVQYFEGTDDDRYTIRNKVMDAYDLNPTNPEYLNTCLRHINSLLFTPEVRIDKHLPVRYPTNKELHIY